MMNIMHFYDSIRFPFLSDLLFDQLLNFDWETSRKEIEEEKKRECKKDCKEDCCTEHSGYLRMLDDDGWNKNLSIYSPKFELGEDDVYRFHTTVPKDVKPEEIHIDAIGGTFYFGYDHKTDNGSFSAASIDALPNDIDINSMEVQELSLAVNGAGDAKVSGKADRASFTVAGVGGIDARNLDCEDIETSKSGIASIKTKK